MTQNQNLGQNPADQIELSREQLDNRIFEPGWDVVASLYGVELSYDPTERLQQLSDISDSHWEQRNGKERHDVIWDAAEGSQQEPDPLNDPESAASRQVFAAADELGLVESSHAPAGEYDWLVVLGGANRSSLQRLMYGLEQEDVTYRRIALLASTRKISDGEKKAVQDFAPDAETEYDVMRAAVAHVFNSRGREFTLSRIGYDHEPDEQGTVERYKTDIGNAYVLCAPTPEGNKRAVTGDTYRLLRTFARNELTPDSEVVISTNAFYTGFQGTDAERELTDITGANVTTIGFDAAYAGVTRLPKQLLSEMRAYVHAMQKRQASLPEPEFEAIDDNANPYLAMSPPEFFDALEDQPDEILKMKNPEDVAEFMRRFYDLSPSNLLHSVTSAGNSTRWVAGAIIDNLRAKKYPDKYMQELSTQLLEADYFDFITMDRFPHMDWAGITNSKIRVASRQAETAEMLRQQGDEAGALEATQKAHDNMVDASYLVFEMSGNGRKTIAAPLIEALVKFGMPSYALNNMYQFPRDFVDVDLGQVEDALKQYDGYWSPEMLEKAKLRLEDAKLRRVES